MGKKLYCGNLSYNTSSEDLEKLFAKFGAVEAVEVAVDSKTGQGAGYGFIQFEREADAIAAEECIDGAEIDAHTLIVSVGHPKSDRCPGGGGPAGGRGGDGLQELVAANAAGQTA